MKLFFVILICQLFWLSGINAANSESLTEAMSQAYDHNPDLAAARAGLRVIDEGVAIAKSGYRPVISGNITGDSTHIDSRSLNSLTGHLNITQKLFDGFATENKVETAKSTVFAGRENLKSNEINILQAAVQAYANLARDNQLVDIRRQNMVFLRQQLNAAQSRLKVGEGTNTEVSQAEAQLASANALLIAAMAQAKSSVAVYTQIIGTTPYHIKQPNAIVALLPESLDAAIKKGLQLHPEILATQHNINIAEFDIETSKATLLPGVSVTGSFSETDKGVTTNTITGKVSIPVYSGGANYARIRQAKQRLSQRKAQLTSAQRRVEQSIIVNWVNYESAVANLSANQAELKAAKLALDGVIEEQRVGQRTVLDVLNAQQTVLKAQENIVRTKRDTVVSSYATLAAMGLLTVDYLNLKVTRYNPDKHYQAVKDKWLGLQKTED